MNEPDFCSLLDCTIPYNLPVWKKVIWLRSYQYRTPLLFGLKNKSNSYISWIKVVILIFNAKILNKESFSEIGNTANSDLGGQQDRGSLIGRGGVRVSTLSRENDDSLVMLSIYLSCEEVIPKFQLNWDPQCIKSPWISKNIKMASFLYRPINIQVPNDTITLSLKLHCPWNPIIPTFVNWHDCNTYFKCFIVVIDFFITFKRIVL